MKLNDIINLIRKDIHSKYDLNNPSENPNRNSNALLDLVITSTMEKVSSHDVLPCPSIKDHDAPFINVNAKIACCERKYKFIRSFKNFSLEKYKMDISKILFLILRTLNNPDEQLNTLTKLVLSVTDENAPLK